MTEDSKNPPERAQAKPRARVTVHDVARMVGVAPSTVSRVLNNGSRSEFIGEETRRRVRDAAAQLGYTPSPIAKALRGGRSNLIGLIVRGIADPFFASLIQQLSDAARGEGYQIVLGYAHGNPNEAVKLSSVLDTRHLDGMVVLGDLTSDEDVLADMLAEMPAAVGLCRGLSFGSLFTINTDNRAGVHALFDHLYSLGHRRIAFLDGESWIGDIRERREAFNERAQSKRLTIPAEYIRKGESGLAGGYQAMGTLLDLPDPPTAVMAGDDMLAISAVKVALDRGLRVPEDISVTGFDDIEMAKYVHPGITTVRQPVDRLAQHALDSLLAIISSQETPTDAILRIQPELVVRFSTAAPRQNGYPAAALR